MTFLKRLGQILAQGLEIVLGLEPIIARQFPNASAPVQVISKDLAAVAQVVVEMEAIGQVMGTAGPDKLKAAAPLVAQVIMQSSLMAGKTVANPALFNTACSEIAGGMADLLNSLSVQGLVSQPVATAVSVAPAA